MDSKKTINLAWASDIHLDHTPPEGIAQFFDWVRERGASSLLPGGDITHSTELDRTLHEIAATSRIRG